MYAEFAGSPRSRPAAELDPPDLLTGAAEPAAQADRRMSRKERKAAKKKPAQEAQAMDEDLAFTLGALSQAASTHDDSSEAQGIREVTEAALSPTSSKK